MKEYAFENGKAVDLKQLRVAQMKEEEYSRAHQHLVMTCHDIVIEYQGGALLVVRDNLPAKSIFWPIGGRMRQGMSIIDSLRIKVREECGLEIKDIKELGVSRTFFRTDPFGHGKGTDTLNIMFYGKGSGELKLDELHKQPMIIMPQEYTPALRDTLHPYVQEIVNKAMQLIIKK